MTRRHIHVVGGRQHNLKDVTLQIPRGAITVFAGVSGSGKTSLVFDTIAAEAQRQLNDTFSTFVRNRLPSYGRPEVDRIDGLSPVVLVDQRRLGGGARSTVGTATDLHPLLRLLFSRAGEPFIGESNRFSFNDPSGMCLTCSGLGRVVTPDVETFVDEERPLEDGAVLVPGYSPGPAKPQYRYRQVVGAGLFDPAVPLRQWSKAERRALLHTSAAERLAKRRGVSLAEDFEGLVDAFTRLYVNTSSGAAGRKESVLARFTVSEVCPDCGGHRLNEEARSVRVAGHSLVEMTAMEVGDLLPVLTEVDHDASGPVVAQLRARLGALDHVGLRYLSLDRATSTLSGGESQRIKTVRHLGSSLTEMLYVFDEPSVGLHPEDVDRLVALLRELRDQGNTLLVVEHDPDVVAVADHVVELGPGAGADGGEVVFDGTYKQLLRSGTTTGRALRERRTVPEPRESDGTFAVTAAGLHNLRDVDVDLPTGVLTVVTGVAGSGKSSLVEVVVEQHPDARVVDQTAVSSSRRSNTATYTGIAAPIRQLFARANGVSASLFSANSEGACPECRGLGTVETDLAFMESWSTVCDTCHGRRFTDEVLEHRLDGRSIADVLDLTVEQARDVFADADDPSIPQALAALVDVGVGYLTLGQPLSSLSGGECQRIKLARELQHLDPGTLFVLDEPTTGLHPVDVTRLLAVFDRLVDAGSTLVVIEHDLDVMLHADWIVDLGPGAGKDGGRIMFSGTVADLLDDDESVTAAHLRRVVNAG